MRFPTEYKALLNERSCDRDVFCKNIFIKFYDTYKCIHIHIYIYYMFVCVYNLSFLCISGMFNSQNIFY